MNHITAHSGGAFQSFPIAVITSLFNSDVTGALQQGAVTRLNALGFHPEDVLLVDVPGAVEIPLVAQRLAMKNRFEVIVALGAVIRGETSHYDYVCEQVSAGCQRVALDYNVPVVFGILTTENDAQAWDRLGGKHGHKGTEAIDCACALQAVLRQF